MGFHVELSQFPIVVCRLDAAECDALQLERQIDAYLGELLTHRGIFVCVHDWTLAGSLPAQCWRLVFARAIVRSELSTQCVAQALAVASPELRGFATASALAHPAAYALRVAASFEAALSWCSWQLKRSESQAV